MDNLKRKAWGDIVKQQYLNGNLEEDSTLSQLEALVSKGLVKIIRAQEMPQLEFYASLQGDEVKSVYVPEDSLSTEELIKYLTIAGSVLTKLNTRTIPLGIETPPTQNGSLLHENTRITRSLGNLKGKVDVNSAEKQEYEDEDSDTRKLKLLYTKDDGLKVVFLAEFSKQWLSVGSDREWEMIEEVLKGKIVRYLEMKSYRLPAKRYVLKCICTDLGNAEDIMVIDSLEALNALTIDEMILRLE